MKLGENKCSLLSSNLREIFGVREKLGEIFGNEEKRFRQDLVKWGEKIGKMKNSEKGIFIQDQKVNQYLERIAKFSENW